MLDQLVPTIANGLPLLSSDCKIVISQYTILRLQILIRQIKALLIRIKSGSTSDDRVIPLLNYILNLSGALVISSSSSSKVINAVWELTVDNLELSKIPRFHLDLSIGSGKKYEIKEYESVDYIKVLNTLVLIFEALLQFHTNQVKLLKMNKIQDGETTLNFELIKPLLESPMEIQSMIKFVIPSDKTRNVQYLSKIPVVLDLLTKQLNIINPFILQLKELQTKMLETYLKKINYWGYILIRSFALLMRINEIQWCLIKFYKDIHISHGNTWKKLQITNLDFKKITEYLESVTTEDGKLDFISEYFSNGKKKLEYNLKTVENFSKKLILKFEQTLNIVGKFEILIKYWKDEVEKQHRARNASLKQQAIKRSPSVRSSSKPQPPISSPTQPKSNESSEPSSPIAVSIALRRSSSVVNKSTTISSQSRSRSGSSASLTSPIKPPVSNQFTTRERSNSNSTSQPPNTAIGRSRSGSDTSLNSQTSSLLNSQRNNSLTNSNKGQVSPSSITRTGSVRGRPKSTIMNQAFDIRTQMLRQQISPKPELSLVLPSSQQVSKTPKPNFKELKGPGVTRTRSSSLQLGQPNIHTPATAAANAIFKKTGPQQRVVSAGPRANSLQSVTDLAKIQENFQGEPSSSSSNSHGKESAKYLKSAMKGGSKDNIETPINDDSVDLENEEEEEEEESKGFEKEVMDSLRKVQLHDNVTPVKQIINLDFDSGFKNATPIQFISSPSTPIKDAAILSENCYKTPDLTLSSSTITTASQSPVLSLPLNKESCSSSNHSDETLIQGTSQILLKKVRFTGVPVYKPEEDKPLHPFKRKGMSAALALKFRNPILNNNPATKDAEYSRQERLTFIKLRNGDLSSSDHKNIGLESSFRASFLNNTNNNSGNGSSKGFGAKWKLFK